MIKIFLLSSGLGNIQRGYESFTKECFDVLSQVPELKVFLFKGAGESSKNSITLNNISRNTITAKYIGKLINTEPYNIEQLTFFLSLIPYIYRKAPHIIYFSDFRLGTFLWHFRRISNLNFKLLYSNGAPNGPPFTRMDYVQHLTDYHYQIAINAGEISDKHILVPYGINIKNGIEVLSNRDKNSLRNRLNLPLDRLILLSVGTINKTHKRMDYLIREVSDLPEPRPYLVMLGEKNEESADIVDLGNKHLGSENFRVLTVPFDKVKDYYSAADVFILASLKEGFGLVFLEAMSYGLPCLAHDYAISRFVLEDLGYFADFTKTGSLANLITQVISDTDDKDKRIARRRFIYERFSWEVLRPKYSEMIRQCAKNN